MRTRRPSSQALSGSRGAAWPTLAALLAALAVLLFPRPASADPGARDVVVRFQGALLDQHEKRIVVKMDLTLPLQEWTDTQGTVQLEPQPGSGRALVRGPDGREEEVQFTARLTRFGAPPVSDRDGVRRWAMRGDLYLSAEGRPLVELEIGPDVEIPRTGEVRRFPPQESWPEGEGSSAAMGRLMFELLKEGRGGGMIHGREIWGRPIPEIPLLGALRIVEIESKPAARGAAEREADRLLNRIQYVSSDYARAVADGHVVNELEYSEQVRLLQEAAVLADRLGVSDAARAALADLRRRVDWKSPPAEVSELCRSLSAELLRTHGAQLASPAPAPLAVAIPLYREHCAKCHGESGDGKGESAKGLDPPPRSFLDVAETRGMTPHRAYMAVRHGVAGTAMASFEAALAEPERWALAFHVMSLRHLSPSAAPRPTNLSFTLDELATSTDDELLRRASAAGATNGPSAVAYFRTAGVDVAARLHRGEPAFGGSAPARGTARLGAALGLLALGSLLAFGALRRRRHRASPMTAASSIPGTPS